MGVLAHRLVCPSPRMVGEYAHPTHCDEAQQNLAENAPFKFISPGLGWVWNIDWPTNPMLTPPLPRSRKNLIFRRYALVLSREKRYPVQSPTARLAPSVEECVSDSPKMLDFPGNFVDQERGRGVLTLPRTTRGGEEGLRWVRRANSPPPGDLHNRPFAISAKAADTIAAIGP